MTADAQQSIDLSGQWRVTTVGQPPAEFTGNGKMVTLPGSNLTNDIGLDPTLDTKWTCSIYDSSFFYNPKMEEFRNAKPIKYPFFLTPNKHFIGHLVYSNNIKTATNLGRAIPLTAVPEWATMQPITEQLPL